MRHCLRVVNVDPSTPWKSLLRTIKVRISVHKHLGRNNNAFELEHNLRSVILANE